MNWKYSDEDLINSAHRYATLGAWRKENKGAYSQARKRGLLPAIKKFLPDGVGGLTAAYTEAQVAEDAKKYKTREEWRQAGLKMQKAGLVSTYNCALGFGCEWIRDNCAHIIKRQWWSDEALIAVAAKYQHKGDWKRSVDRKDAAAYQSAALRPEVFLKATAHMTAKANPYAGDYIIYAYEFADGYVYVGLTFRDRVRHTQHMQDGPVHDHKANCPEFVYKVVEENIPTPSAVQIAEGVWEAKYREEGWKMLNTAPTGSLGAVDKLKWTKEAVLAKAKEYTTKQAWIDGSQFTYRLAKREGWFKEASAHMPKRVLGVGVGVKKSVEARKKMSESAKNRKKRPTTP